MKLYANLTEINAKIGQRITLSCFAEGNPKPKIIWHKIGRSKNQLNWIEINWINFNYNETDDVLEHNDNLELNVDGDDDAGHYECVAHNGVDEKQSKIISVYINSKKLNFYKFCAASF